MTNIAIFASGTGSNARKIIEHFYSREDVCVSLIISNKKTAKVLDLANEYDGICKFVLDKDYLYESRDLINILREENIEFIVLAGFLWLIPPYLTQHYPNKIVNIHPALLPKYGGKGMYGMNVHRAVKASGDTKSGPTIHLVNEEYDKGTILFQTSTEIDPNDSPEDIASKVLKLEHQHYPIVIDQWIKEHQAINLV